MPNVPPTFDNSPFDETLLTAYLDDELSLENKAIVEQEIAKSARLRQLLSDLESVRAMVLKSAIEAPAYVGKIHTGPWMHSAAESQDASVRIKSKRAINSRAWKLAALAASLALTTIFSLWILQARKGTEAPGALAMHSAEGQDAEMASDSLRSSPVETREQGSLQMESRSLNNAQTASPRLEKSARMSSPAQAQNPTSDASSTSVAAEWGSNPTEMLSDSPSFSAAMADAPPEAIRRESRQHEPMSLSLPSPMSASPSNGPNGIEAFNADAMGSGAGQEAGEASHDELAVVPLRRAAPPPPEKSGRIEELQDFLLDNSHSWYDVEVASRLEKVGEEELVEIKYLKILFPAKDWVAATRVLRHKGLAIAQTAPIAKTPATALWTQMNPNTTSDESISASELTKPDFEWTFYAKEALLNPHRHPVWELEITPIESDPAGNNSKE